MKLVGEEEEQNEQEMMFPEKDVKHLERKVDEMGVICVVCYFGFFLYAFGNRGVTGPPPVRIFIVPRSI